MTVTLRRKDLLTFGTPIKFEDEKDSDPGFVKDIGFFAITQPKIWLTQLFVDAGQDGRITVWRKPIAGADVLIGHGRITPASPNFHFSWAPILPIVKDERVIVRFEALAGRPVANVKVCLQAAVP